MKTTAIIFLLFSIGIQTFSKWVIVLGYEINKDYIAKNLCVNRKDPVSSCMGKCYLTKKIAADEDRQQPAGKVSYQKDLQLDCFLNSITYKAPGARSSVNAYNSFYLSAISSRIGCAVFQPPKFAWHITCNFLS